MITDGDLVRIKNALKKATPGPWPIAKTGDGKRIIVGEGLVDGPNGYDVAEVYSDDCDSQEAMANAEIIAWFRNHGSELIARLEFLEQLEETPF